jgi:hypothetical protein
MSRWSKSGVLDRLFEQLQHAQITRAKIEVCPWTKHHREGPSEWHGGFLKSLNPSPRMITKIHMVAADARTVITFACPQVISWLSPVRSPESGDRLSPH